VAVAPQVAPRTAAEATPGAAAKTAFEVVRTTALRIERQNAAHTWMRATAQVGLGAAHALSPETGLQVTGQVTSETAVRTALGTVPGTVSRVVPEMTTWAKQSAYNLTSSRHLAHPAAAQVGKNRPDLVSCESQGRSGPEQGSSEPDAGLGFFACATRYGAITTFRIACA
jgi:hypothetical protein